MEVRHWPFGVSDQGTKGRTMARNWMDERREKREVVARLAGLFREIDEFMTAVKSPAAKRRLPLATHLDLWLKAVRMMIEVYKGLPDIGPLPTVDLRFVFLEERHPELHREWQKWLMQ